MKFFPGYIVTFTGLCLMVVAVLEALPPDSHPLAGVLIAFQGTMTACVGIQFALRP